VSFYFLLKFFAVFGEARFVFRYLLLLPLVPFVHQQLGFIQNAVFLMVERELQIVFGSDESRSINHTAYGHFINVPWLLVLTATSPLAPRPTIHSRAWQKGRFGIFISTQPRL
jgi:hypothetical protein